MFTLLLILIYSTDCSAYGYDAGSDQGACGKPYRASRMHQPPCDLGLHSYCTSAGSMYPWHAVRRFIRENQGLMRRMYGDERHIAVLKAELETNDIDDISYRYNSPEEVLRNDFKNRYAKQEDVYEENELPKDENTPRHLQENSKRDDILNTKFIYSEEPNLNIKLSDLKTVPHFKPTTPKIAEKTTTAQSKTNESDVSENFTEASTEYENATVTEANAETTTTEEVTEGTTVLNEDTTTENNKKEPSETILFQDVEDNKVQNQMNFKLRGVNACPVKEEVVAPFWANNTRGEILALLNLYPFEQYVHWEKCTYEHRQMYCREGCRCEQQYRLHRLLAYDPNNECRGIFSDWFRFPSCCVCKCYNMPVEFRVTSRSPRHKEKEDGNLVPSWFKRKNRMK